MAQVDEAEAAVANLDKLQTTSEQTIADLNASLGKVKQEYAQHLEACKLAAEKATKKINDVTSSAVAAKTARDKMILETELELKSSNDALAKMTKQHSDVVAANVTASKELEALKGQIEKAKDEKAMLTKKINDVTSSAVAAKTARDKMILETELELKGSQEALAVMTKQLAASKQQEETSAAAIALASEYQQYKIASEQSIAGQEKELVELKSQLARITDKSRQRINHLEGMTTRPVITPY